MYHDNCVLSRPWEWAFTNFSTNGSFAEFEPTATKPVQSQDNGIYDLWDNTYGAGTQAGLVPTHVIVQAILTNGDGDLGNFRVHGIRQIGRGDNAVYVYTNLAEVAVTACTVDADELVADGQQCDTYALTDGADSHAGTYVVSPENNTPGHAMIALKGHRWIRFETDINTGAVSMNLLWSPLNMPT